MDWLVRVSTPAGRRLGAAPEWVPPTAVDQEAALDRPSPSSAAGSLSGGALPSGGVHLSSPPANIFPPTPPKSAPAEVDAGAGTPLVFAPSSSAAVIPPRASTNPFAAPTVDDWTDATTSLGPCPTGNPFATPAPLTPDTARVCTGGAAPLGDVCGGAVNVQPDGESCMLAADRIASPARLGGTALASAPHGEQRFPPMPRMAVRSSIGALDHALGRLGLSVFPFDLSHMHRLYETLGVDPSEQELRLQVADCRVGRRSWWRRSRDQWHAPDVRPLPGGCVPLTRGGMAAASRRLTHPPPPAVVHAWHRIYLAYGREPLLDELEMRANDYAHARLHG